MMMMMMMMMMVGQLKLVAVAVFHGEFFAGVFGKKNIQHDKNFVEPQANEEEGFAGVCFFVGPLPNSRYLSRLTKLFVRPTSIALGGHRS